MTPFCKKIVNDIPLIFNASVGTPPLLLHVGAPRMAPFVILRKMFVFLPLGLDKLKPRSELVTRVSSGFSVDILEKTK